MKLRFEPFHKLFSYQTTAATRERYLDSSVETIEIFENNISAEVRGTYLYNVEIKYDVESVSSALCNCPYDAGGYCKHIANVLVYADATVAEMHQSETDRATEQAARSTIVLPEDLVTRRGKSYVLNTPSICNLSQPFLEALAPEKIRRNRYDAEEMINIPQVHIEPDSIQAIVTVSGYSFESFKISIAKEEEQIVATCDCLMLGNKLCSHLYLFVKEMQSMVALQLAFDHEKRREELLLRARSKGWQNIADLDDFFQITMSYNRLFIEPKVNILSLAGRDREELRKSLITEFSLPQSDDVGRTEFILLSESYYDKSLEIAMMTAPLAKAGGMKAPIEAANLNDKLKATSNSVELQFYIAMTAQRNYAGDIDHYRTILTNPLGLQAYYYKLDTPKGALAVRKLKPLRLHTVAPTLKLHVKESGAFYLITCQIELENTKLNAKRARQYKGLLLYDDDLYCLNNEAEIKVVDFFAKNDDEVYLEKSKFALFKEEFLDLLENSISILYSFGKPATKKMIKEQSLDKISKPVIYLSDQDNFVLITPVISYGDVEVPVLSSRTAYAMGDDYGLYAIKRDAAIEQQLIRNVQTQHLAFDKVPMTEFFYLHKKEFLDEGWFINAFDAWQTAGYTIRGFNQIKDNRYNQHKISIRSSVQSGIDWFDIHTKVSFGDQEVSLKQLQKSVLNKSRYIELGDGTQGILPTEWIEKFGNYFRAGEIKDEHIRAHKSNFQLIDELFEKEVLSQEVQDELRLYKEKLANFQTISSVNVPKALTGTLRDYQKEGLNWLNFLDEFGFGGCLADDMGLGKTIQIIAHFLAQEEKDNTGTNLIVLPTSLLFNWQNELDKFAPSLKYHVLYGTSRSTEKIEVTAYDVIITTYGTLLSDIEFLKKQRFNIVVLDESQAIKNPDSKRYKAVRLLQGRQRLVLTGTPVENNTFDLYAQLSFALPGLLGNAKRFATDYSTPIDRFQDAARARELQRKIHPFVLRRTKKQVAKELPEKTEMLLHCEMGVEQKRIYESYKTEFQKYLKGLDEEELHSSSLHVLQGLTKLRQICNSPALLGDDAYYGNESAKLDEIIRQIMSLKDQHKILVFSQFVGMLDLIKSRLEEEGIGYAYLTGKTKNRQEQVELFQEDDSIPVFLISLKAGGTGLNLTQAEYVFLIDPWWNPAVENQAIDRAYRIGQQNNVVAVRLVTPDSIEEKIIALQERKRRLAEDIIHTDANVLKQLSRDDLINLL